MGGIGVLSAGGSPTYLQYGDWGGGKAFLRLKEEKKPEWGAALFFADGPITCFPPFQPPVLR